MSAFGVPHVGSGGVPNGEALVVESIYFVCMIQMSENKLISRSHIPGLCRSVIFLVVRLSVKEVPDTGCLEPLSSNTVCLYS